MSIHEYKNMVCLYIFTHNKTGLKYFGKTTKAFDEKSLLTYGGSGIYWRNHLKKHGKDLSVKIYGIYKISEVKEIALKFSEDNDIVKAVNEDGNRKGKKIWANEKEEDGLGGGKHSEKTKNKISKTKRNKTKEEKKIISDKALSTLKSDFVNGLDGLQRKMIKSALTLKEKGYEERTKKNLNTRLLNNNADEVSKRISEGLNKKGEDGLTPAQRSGLAAAKTVNERSGKFTLVTKDKIYKNLYIKDLRALSPALLKLTEFELLGKDSKQRELLKIKNANLIGAYYIRQDKEITMEMLNLYKDLEEYFNIMNNEDKIIYNKLTRSEVKKLSQSLLKTNSNKRLGDTNKSYGALKRVNKTYQKGWYCEKVR
jgi:hypothetical protein